LAESPGESVLKLDIERVSKFPKGGVDAIRAVVIPLQRRVRSLIDFSGPAAEQIGALQVAILAQRFAVGR